MKVFFQTKANRYRRLMLLIFTGLAVIICTVNQAWAEQFPEYSCISSNIAFWEKVYSQYSLSQGIIHDKENLAIIYDVIELVHPDQPGSRRVNVKRIKKAKNKYKLILKKLAKGKKASTSEGRKVMALFGPDAKKSDYKAAISNIRSQLGQKDRFRKGVIRSGAYLQKIKKIFRTYGIPSDLAYLAHVESSFNPKAYSKFGAAGIWQFTRSTGKLFMNVDYTLDERRDPIKSSHSAAKLLKQNYEKLGNWPLAITAYNHGANGMLRAKKAKGGYEKIFKEHDGGAFRFASRNFYSEFLAARNVAKNYRQYFGDLVLDAPEHTKEVMLAGYAPVRDLAEHFGISVQEIQHYNPGLREPVFLGRKYVPKGYTLRLPYHSENLTELATNIPDEIYYSSQKRSRFYRVQRGDTAGMVAKRHGVKVRELILANNLGREATIYVGQNLRIPGAGEDIQHLAKSYKQKVAGPVLLASIDADDELAAGRVDRDEPEVARVEEQPEAAAAKAELAVTAGAGPKIKIAAIPTKQKQAMEFAMAISHDFSFFPDEDPGWELPRIKGPQELESRDDEVFLTDNDIEIPRINPEIIIGNLEVEKIEVKNGKTQGRIRVEAEETLGHYASWLEVATSRIRAYNGLKYGRMIMINQPITIPLEKVDKQTFEERRYEYHKEIEEDFFAAFTVEQVKGYLVRRGDNIWNLCNDEFELPLWLVRKYNAEIDLNNLMAKQKLLIPVVVKKENNFAENSQDDLDSRQTKLKRHRFTKSTAKIDKTAQVPHGS